MDAENKEGGSVNLEPRTLQNNPRIPALPKGANYQLASDEAIGIVVNSSDISDDQSPEEMSQSKIIEFERRMANMIK